MNVKKFLPDEINITKNTLFFVRERQLITVLLLICHSFTSWTTWFISKIVCEIFHFQFRQIFCLTKCMSSLTLKCHNSFQNKNNTKTTHRIAPRPLVFKLRQEVQIFNNICGSWTEEDIFLLFGISLLNKLFISFHNRCISFTLSWRRPLSYRNHSIDLHRKSMDWFLYDNGLRHERVNWTKEHLIKEHSIKNIH